MPGDTRHEYFNMSASTPSPTILRARLVATSALVAAIALATAACQTTQTAETTGSLAMSSTPQTGGDPRQNLESWSERYRAQPADPHAAIGYAQALRANGQRAQAVAVLERASIQSPKNTELLGAFGRALADNGDYRRALEVLERAHSPDQPDWHVLSAQGAVLDQMGQHGDAQRYYAAALKIAPDEPSVLSNLGLSYALSKDLVKAEATLKRAAAAPRVDPRVRQNLALVVGLQGRFAEAEAIAQADLPPDEAAANVAYLRQMLAEQSGLRNQSAQPKQPPAPKPTMSAARS
jgi:Flp pilus assembly protein TadD